MKWLFNISILALILTFSCQGPSDEKEKAITHQLWEGYPVNISDGRAALAWEFADSEAYILEGHEPWTEEELSQKIKVKGELVQNESGSYLKNWEIIE